MLQEDDEMSYKKAITQEIKFKHRVFRSERDVIEDADNWMGEIDRKFLGIPSKKNKNDPLPPFKAEIKMEDPAEIIDFFQPDVQ